MQIDDRLIFRQKLTEESFRDSYDAIQIREFLHRLFKSFARASAYLAGRVCVIFDRLSSDSE